MATGANIIRQEASISPLQRVRSLHTRSSPAPGPPREQSNQRKPMTGVLPGSRVVLTRVPHLHLGQAAAR